ncbi:MAG: phosphatase PAP2 family protein [Acidobacteriota bacterium]|nr:phosphatase PAP2 family protein [Acidobacteriota bacterium]
MIFIAAFIAVYLTFWLLLSAGGPLLERGLRAAAQRSARFRHRDYVPVFALIAIGIVATAAAGDAFMDIAESVQAESTKLHDVDTATHAWAHETRTQGATEFFTLMTIIGTPVGLAVLDTIVAAVLALRKHWHWSVYLLITAGIGGLLNLLLKRLFSRARPELAEALRGAHGYSFPSGHAMGSTITFCALSYLAFRAFKSWRVRAAIVALFCSMIVAIATSRIYLGVHWISDVGAGISAGLIWFVAATVAYETWRRIRLVRALRAKGAG